MSYDIIGDIHGHSQSLESILARLGYKNQSGIYRHPSRQVFLGHYWMEGEPAPLAPNIACLDYSVAKPGGRLVAYRWDGEQTIDAGKYVWVDRIES